MVVQRIIRWLATLGLVALIVLLVIAEQWTDYAGVVQSAPPRRPGEDAGWRQSDFFGRQDVVNMSWLLVKISIILLAAAVFVLRREWRAWGGLNCLLLQGKQRQSGDTPGMLLHLCPSGQEKPVHYHLLVEQAEAAMNGLQDAVLESWMRALAVRDGETQEHSARLAGLAVRLAEALGVRGEELLHLRRGALLHDIGKIGIPDAILHKPGPLTEQERAIMRQHPLYAYHILVPMAYLRPALDIPLYHHERWNGTGYPTGLKGVDIPLVARIFAVVDVWDALRSDRPYRASWSEEQVRGYMREQAGEEFDPQVVGVFLGMLGGMGSRSASS